MKTQSLESIERFYKIHSLVYDYTRWMILFSRDEAAKELVTLPGGDYLEIGCGTGLNFGRILRQLGPQGTLTGLDFSPDMLAVARKRVDRDGMKQVSLVRENAETFDLGRKFDGILFSYSITMIPNWRAAVERCMAHLKPGGKMVVLDFYTLEGWPGPFRKVFRWWLGANHVDNARDYPEYLSKVAADFNLKPRNLGWNFIATGRAPGLADS